MTAAEYIVMHGGSVACERPSLLREMSDPADALRVARTTQARRGGACWVERDDGVILGGTFAYTGNDAAYSAIERINVARGFLPPTRRPFKHRWGSEFACDTCGHQKVALDGTGNPRCERCDAPLYRQKNGAVVRHHNRLCALCGEPAIRLEVIGARMKSEGRCGQCANRQQHTE